MNSNNKNQNDNDDKLRVVTAEEVLAELKRRQELYGSPYLPSDSYQKVKRVNTPSQTNVTNSSKQETKGGKTSQNSRNGLKKTFLFLEQFAFKKPLQSVIAVFMLLGITAGVYLAGQPTGSFDNREEAIGTITSDITIKTVPNNIQKQPDIYCKPNEIYDAEKCAINRITTKAIKSIVVLSKPEFFDLKFDYPNQVVRVSKLRELRADEIDKSFPVKIQAIGDDIPIGNGTAVNNPKLLFVSFKATNSTYTPSENPISLVRNPVNKTNGSLCEVLDEASAKSNWKKFSDTSNCENTKNVPVISTPENIGIKYQFSCKNTSTTAQTVSFELNATDKDGDLTGFSLTGSPSNGARLSESFETYVKRITSDVESNNKKWETYTYKNGVKLDLTTADIGKTIPLSVYAYNLTDPSQDIQKNINVKVIDSVTGASTNISPAITSPVKNQVLKGKSDVTWQLKNGCDYVRYKVELWDKYCTTFKGKITEELTANTVSGGVNFSNSFDTRVYPDGNYCVRVFVRNTTTEAWKVSSSGSFAIQNSTNRSPQIISNPTNTTLKVGQKFSYTVVAQDPDNDQVTLEYNKKPSWLTSSGLNMSGISNNVGSYEVSFRLKDSKGAYSNYQVFTVNYVTSTDTPTSLTFLSPTAGTSISGSYVVKWQITEPDGIKSQAIYISDKENWTKLADLNPKDTQYTLDTTKYPNGDYQLKLIVLDNKGNSTENISGIFTIQQTTTSDVTSLVSITSLQPADNSEITDTKPEIKVVYVLPEGITLNSSGTKVLVNDLDISKDCKTESTSLSCIPSSDLSLGSNKVSVTFKDSNENTQVETWSFTIISASSTTTSIVSDGNYQVEYLMILGRNIPKNLAYLLGILCLVGLLIFLLPILIFKVLGKKKKNEGDDNTPPNDTPPNEPYSEEKITETKSDELKSGENKIEFSDSYKQEVGQSQQYDIPVENPNTPGNASQSSANPTSYQSNNDYGNVSQVNNNAPK